MNRSHTRTSPFANSRRTRRGSITILICLLALGTPALPALEEDVAPAAELLTVVGDWEKSADLAGTSSAAVEGLAVEIRSGLLAGGQKRLGFQDFSGRHYEAELERLERPMPGAAVWIGKIAEYGDHSQVLLATHEGAVAGFIDTPEARYEILPRPGGQVMLKLDPSRFAACGTDETEHPVPADQLARAARSLGVDPEAVWQQASANKSTAVIEIAVLFSETTFDKIGSSSGALSVALAATAVLDTALSTSNVDAQTSLKGWEMISADDLGDSSGGGDGMVLALYSDGSGIAKANDQGWHQAHPDLGDSANSGDAFGEVLATGDFDGDGYDDLAIGIPGEDIDGESNVGAVQILYGSSSRLTSTDTDFFHQDSPGVDGGNQSGDQFGFALAVGDFDNDGYDDLAIGKPFEDLDGKSNTGRVQVMYGSSGGISTSGETILDQNVLSAAGSNENGDKFGRALAAGDFDGDGYDDLAIGAPEEDTSGDKAGQVVVVFGASGGLNTNDNQAFTQDSDGVADSTEKNDRFGFTLAAGDFDDDGYDDLVVSAPHEDTGGKDNAGVIHVLFGTSSGLTGIGSQYFDQDDVGGGTENNDYFGYTLAVGDFNNDGYEDLAASAPWENSEVGRVHLLFGRSTGLANSGFYITGGTNNGFLGMGLAAGDFDNDGFDDLAIGQPGADTSSADASGLVLIYEGSAALLTFDSSWGQSSSGITGVAEDDDEVGYALATGDFDGDGDSDLAAGSPGEGISNDSDYFKSWLGASSITTSARANYSADLVGLIVEHLTDACGSAQGVLGNTSGSSGTYYQVTDRECAVGNMTFAHELGHLLGLAHDPANAGTSGACSDARGHYVSGKGRTLMSYSTECSNNDCSRRAILSNPDVDFSFGNPSGISGSRDNARCAELTVGNVAGYN